VTDDWATIASLATAGGTLILALATFAAVRSSNRAARATERALLAGIRPVLASARHDDPVQKVGFADDRWFKVESGRSVVELADDAIYLVVPGRNVGNGLAGLDRWDIYASRVLDGTYRDPASFRRLTRDLFVPAGDVGFWQGALRETGEPIFAEVRDAIRHREPMMIDLLYGDHDGGQRTITRFGLFPHPDGWWFTSVGRHWNLDRDDPR